MQQQCDENNRNDRADNRCASPHRRRAESIGRSPLTVTAYVRQGCRMHVQEASANGVRVVGLPVLSEGLNSPWGVSGPAERLQRFGDTFRAAGDTCDGREAAMKLASALLVLLIATACAKPDVDALMAQGCEHVLAGEWERAKAPLAKAAEASDWSGEPYRLYSFVRSAHPAEPPDWLVDELGPEEAYKDHASAAKFGAAWEANAREMCEQLPPPRD